MIPVVNTHQGWGGCKIEQHDETAREWQSSKKTYCKTHFVSEIKNNEQTQYDSSQSEAGGSNTEAPEYI